MSIRECEAIWQGWKAGETPTEIGRALGWSQPSVFGFVRSRGGVAPAPQRRAARVLGLAEREEISRGLAAGLSIRAISHQLRRAPSTVSREVRRHGGRPHYRAQRADRRAWQRARRPKICRLAQAASLRATVIAKLAARWSPEQIAGWLKRTYPDTAGMQVSHETIYRTLFIQSRGVLNKALIQQLRRRKTFRRARAADRRPPRRGIPDAISIRERPAGIEDRAVPGHWEGDLLTGAGHSHIATLVERRSRYVLLVRLENKETSTVVRALTRRVRALPQGLMASLTVDRGLEFAAHHRFTVATDVAVYFCDPRSPWQRGSNENTNGLLRQYFPREVDLSTVSQARLNHVARELNQRPRKTLGFETPAGMLATIVASTG